MMLNDIYARAEKMGVEIDDVPMRAVASASFPEGWIAMDSSKLETCAEEKVALAHELGHIESGSFYNIYSPLDLRAKCEYKADKRAIQMLLPIQQVKRALRAGVREPWELSDFFGVAEPFVNKAMRLYADELRGIC